MSLSLPFAAVLRRIGAQADRLDIDAYLVGGAVRDALLGRVSPDLDVVTVGEGSGIRLAKAVAEALGGQTAHVYENFGTAAVRVPPESVPVEEGEAPPEETLVLEFVGARTESYRRDSRKPIVEDGTLEEDLTRRDFTVNALAVSLGEGAFGEITDPFEGLSDLSARTLRTPLDPDVTFEDDPLRMLRAARFAAQLDFEIEEQALAAMRDNAARVEILSPERITEELNKMLGARVPSTGFRILFQTGLLEHVLPELAALQGVEAVGGRRHKDNFYHTLEVLDNLAHLQRGAGVVGEDERATGDALWGRWAALLHDIAKPDTKRFTRSQGWTFHGHEDLGSREHVPRIFRRLRLPLGEPLDRVRKLIRLHHRPTALVDDDVTDSAVRRLLFDAGDDLEALMRLVRADITSKNPRRARRYLNGFDRVEAKFEEVEAKDRLRNFQPPVDGHEIMEMIGRGEGVAVGMLKEWVREAILEGEIPNEHAAARAYVAERTEEAKRRGALFQTMIQSLAGPEKGALGAIKEAIFWGELPADRDAALDHLEQVKAEALAERDEP